MRRGGTGAAQRRYCPAGRFAGAALGSRIRSGSLVLEDGDIDELLSGLASFADKPGTPWFAEGADGSVQQRTEAFANGSDRKSAACS